MVLVSEVECRDKYVFHEMRGKVSWSCWFVGCFVLVEVKQGDLVPGDSVNEISSRPPPRDSPPPLLFNFIQPG
jgi:hypothetical protein